MITGETDILLTLCAVKGSLYFVFLLNCLSTPQVNWENFFECGSLFEATFMQLFLQNCGMFIGVNIRCLD